MIRMYIFEKSYKYMIYSKQKQKYRYMRYDGATEVYDCTQNGDIIYKYYLKDILAHPTFSCNKIMKYLIDENIKSKYKEDII